MNESKPIAAYREFLPIERQAELGVLPDSLTIADIAALHPDGDAFACLLLEAFAVYLYRNQTPDSIPNVDAPRPEQGNGLPAEMASGAAMLELMLYVPNWESYSLADDPRNGLYIFVHRDDLKDWLQEVGLSLPPDALLNAWWNDDQGQSAKDPDDPIIEKRAKAILSAAQELKFRPLEIPDGGKAAIKKICLKNAALFTPDTFLKAWTEAAKQGLIRMKNVDKFRPSKSRQM